MVRNYLCLGATFLMGRDDSIRLPTLDDYADGREVKVHTEKSKEVVEVMDGLVNLIRQNVKYIVDLR